MNLLAHLPEPGTLTSWMFVFGITAFFVWLAASVTPVAYVLLTDPDRRKELYQAFQCQVTHDWYRVVRVPVGGHEEIEVWCCRECGDRWCQRR